MPAPLDVGALGRLVAADFRNRADELGLSARALTVDYVLNWGGFVNQSFRIGDGARRYHLKLSGHPDGQASLAAWHRIHDDLSAKYRAPPVLGWIDVAGSGHRGLLFPHLDGTMPPTWSRALRRSVASVVMALHADRDLRDRAFPGFEPPSCEAGYQEDYHRRFVADLASVAAERPGFVSASTLAWMTSEVGRLAEQVTRNPAFARPAAALIHGDLWSNNVLLMPNGDWFLLDWDDLRIGDPVLDLAKLLDPGTDDDPPDDQEIVSVLGTDPDARRRLDLYARATMLDWVIDPLADYVEAGQAPECAEAVRTEKARQHREALARYRRRYPAGTE